jgi:parallel beta-helix repeat protein
MRRLSCSVLVGVLVVAAGALAEEARECTVTVQPGQSIQAAIAGAQEGAVICLGEGSWQENLKIEKALTLRGQGAQKTVIDGIQEGYPVVWVVGAQPIEVKLEGLKVTGAEGGCADWPICAFGVLIQGTASWEPGGWQISPGRDHRLHNLWEQVALLGDSAQAKGHRGLGTQPRQRSPAPPSLGEQICWHRAWGLSPSGDHQFHHLKEGWHRACDSAQAEITTISENGAGIVLRDSAQAEITNNLIRGNGRAGIASSSAGPVTGSKNRMQENGVDLVGNLPAGLRLPLVEATKQEIRLPDPAYPSLQHAVDALLPGGRLILARGAYAGGVTIEKDLTIEALEGAEARLEGGYCCHLPGGGGAGEAGWAPPDRQQDLWWPGRGRHRPSRDHRLHHLWEQWMMALCFGTQPRQRSPIPPSRRTGWHRASWHSPGRDHHLHHL